MDSQHATQKRFTDKHPPYSSRLRHSDALWLRRGQRLGELLLVSKASAYGWAAALGLMGASLILLGLVGSYGGPEGASLGAGDAFPP